MDGISKVFGLELAEAGKLANWIGDQLDSATVPNTLRSRNAMVLYHTVFTHHSAILTLFDRGFRISALALLRPLLESYLRGFWVENTANEVELTAFLQGNNSPNFTALESSFRAEEGHEDVAKLAKLLWGRLCDFTHSGAGLINRNQDQENIGDVTPERDCMSSIFLCDTIVILTSIRVSRLIENPDFENNILNIFYERKDRYEAYRKSALA